MHLRSSFSRFAPRRAAIKAVVATAAAGMLATPLLGQETPATSARVCLDSVNAYQQQQLSALATSGRTYAQVVAATRTRGAQCIEALRGAAIPDAELPQLARLELISGDTVAAGRTIDRYLALPMRGDTVRAERYLATIPLLISSRSDSAFARAEWLASTLDTASGVAPDAKIVAHGKLLAYYRAVDDDDKIERHASRIIALTGALDSVQRARAASTLVLAYRSLAEVHGDRADAPAAIAVLERGLRELASIPVAVSTLTPVRDRYALVGTKGASIAAPWWLNAPNGTTSYSPAGRLTLLEFSAHWCGPCRKSYDAITRLQRRYGEHGLTTVFSTELYGFFGDRQHLTAEQELAANREYYLTEHALPVRVAVSPQSESPDTNIVNYKVSGIPQIVVLDRNGIIRMIVVGWDPASEQRIAALLDTLARERGA